MCDEFSLATATIEKVSIKKPTFRIENIVGMVRVITSKHCVPTRQSSYTHCLWNRFEKLQRFTKSHLSDRKATSIKAFLFLQANFIKMFIK